MGLARVYLKRATLAGYASHHPPGLNELYQYSYLFAYSMELRPHARMLTRPKNGDIRVLAISVARENPEVEPAQLLYDTLPWTDRNEKEQVQEGEDKRMERPSGLSCSTLRKISVLLRSTINT